MFNLLKEISKVLSQGMLSNSIFCQYLAQHSLEMIHKQFLQSKIYHQINDSIHANSEAHTSGNMIDEVKGILSCWGKIAPKKLKVEIISIIHDIRYIHRKFDHRKYKSEEINNKLLFFFTYK